MLPVQICNITYKAFLPEIKSKFHQASIANHQGTEEHVK